MTKKTLVLCLIAAVAFGTASLLSFAAQDTDAYRVASLVSEMNSLNSNQLASLEPIEVQPYTIPQAGVDVMRVRLTETYEVEGIGEDTIELTGWIAVHHGEPQLVPGATEVAWGNVVIGTQFLALELEGNSDIFGPVKVSLDGDRPAYGKVGAFELSEKAKVLLASRSGDSSPGKGACTAPTNVKVSMPQLGLEMKTAKPAVWNSSVSTIPPVGEQASVTIEPVSMVSDSGRQVGTLLSGEINFREVVRKVELEEKAGLPVQNIAP